MTQARPAGQNAANYRDLAAQLQTRYNHTALPCPLYDVVRSAPVCGLVERPCRPAGGRGQTGPDQL